MGASRRSASFLESARHAVRFHLLSLVAQPAHGGRLGRLVRGPLHVLPSLSRAGRSCVAALIVSHWVLDATSHRPDVPLWPGAARSSAWASGTRKPQRWPSRDCSLVSGRGCRSAHRTRGQHRALRVRRVVHRPRRRLRREPPGAATAERRRAGLVTQALWLFVIWGCWVDRHRVAIRQW